MYRNTIRNLHLEYETMSCYSVFDQKTNKQIRVFAYEITSQSDRQRAKRLAFEMAQGMHEGGHPCNVEQFHMSDIIGKQVLNTNDLTV
jgi:hypothetical protein